MGVFEIAAKCLPVLIMGMRIKFVSDKMAVQNCEFHSRSLELYCSTDRQFICIECQFSSQHEGHRFELASRIRQQETSNETTSEIDKAEKKLKLAKNR